MLLCSNMKFSSALIIHLANTIRSFVLNSIWAPWKMRGWLLLMMFIFGAMHQIKPKLHDWPIQLRMNSHIIGSAISSRCNGGMMFGLMKALQILFHILFYLKFKLKLDKCRIFGWLLMCARPGVIAQISRLQHIPSLLKLKTLMRRSRCLMELLIRRARLH